MSSQLIEEEQEKLSENLPLISYSSSGLHESIHKSANGGIELFRGQEDDVDISEERIDFKWLSTVRGNYHVPTGKKAYYEVTFLKGAKYVARSQVGWVTEEFSTSKVNERLGDCKNSYAYDAQRGFKSHNGLHHDMGREFTSGDPNAEPNIVLSVAADRSNGTILFGIDGKWNTRFYDVRPNVKFYPAISGNDITVSINFGEREFKYGPPDETYKSLKVVNDESHAETDRRQPLQATKRYPPNHTQSYFQLLLSAFMLKVVLIVVSVGILVADMYSDVMISIDHYHGSQISHCNDSSKPQMKINGTDYKSRASREIFQPYWFTLTVIFVLLPSVIRIASSSVDQLWNTYLPGKLPKKPRGFPGILYSWSIKLLIFPIFPLLIVIYQMRTLYIIFLIECREKEKYPKESITETIKEITKDLKGMFCALWNFLLGRENNVDERVSEDDLSKSVELKQIVVEITLDDATYERTKLLELYDELSDISEDRFFETFLESGPQAILQLTILFQLCLSNEISLIMLITIGSSLYSLAYAVVMYEINLIKRNPAKSEPRFIGQLLITLSKVPAIAARCIALALFFSSTSIKYKIIGFLGIGFITLVFAVYEYSFFLNYSFTQPGNSDHPGLSKLLVRMLSRGYVSNFALLHYRTTHFVKDRGQTKWHDMSEHSKDPPELFPAQYIYYILMGLVNTLLVYPLYVSDHLRRGFFCDKKIDVILVCMGAPMSIIFTLLYQRLQDKDWVTQRLGIRSLDALVHKMIQLIKNKRFHDCNSLLKRMDRNEQKRLLKMIEDDQGAFDSNNLLDISDYLSTLVINNNVAELKNALIFASLLTHNDQLIKFGKAGKHDTWSVKSMMYDPLQTAKRKEVERKTKSEILCSISNGNVPVLYEARESDDNKFLQVQFPNHLSNMGSGKGEMLVEGGTEENYCLASTTTAIATAVIGLNGWKRRDKSEANHQMLEMHKKANYPKEWPGAHGHVSFLHNGIVYLWTGCNELLTQPGLPTDVIWLHNIDTEISETREIRGDSVSERHGACVGVIKGRDGTNDKALLFGGWEIASATSTSDIWELDLETFECKRLHPENPPDPQYGMMSWVWKNELYIYAGIIDEYEQRTNQLMKFSNGNWKLVITKGTPPTVISNTETTPTVISDIIMTANISEKYGKVFALVKSKKQVKSVYSLDLKKMEWVCEDDDIPLPDIDGGSAVLVDPCYVVIPTGTIDGKVWVIDMLSKDCWTVAVHPQEYCCGSYIYDASVEWCAVKKKLLVFGGVNKGEQNISKHILHLDLENLSMAFLRNHQTRASLHQIKRYEHHLAKKEWYQTV